MSEDYCNCAADPDEYDEDEDDEDDDEDEEEEEDDRISCCTACSFAAPTVATLPFFMMFGMYGNKYYESFGASLAIIALFTALRGSIDIMSDPLMSYITDTARCGSFGRRRPFMLIGCFVYGLFLYLLVNPPYWDETWLSIWYGITSTLFFLAATFVIIPYDALGPELSTNSDERTKVFFLSNVFDGVGTLFALILPVAMTQVASSTSKDNQRICKPEPEVVDRCLQGQTCGDFLYEGPVNNKGAFAMNHTLIELLANLSFREGFAIPDAMKQCIDFELDYNMTRVSMLPGASSLQQANFCNCMAGCYGACDIANKRKGFEYVGYIFSTWFVVSMLICVFVVRERGGRTEVTPPIVPSLRSTFLNKPFAVLLPAWMVDNFGIGLVSALVPYFIESVVKPEYMTMEDHGYDCYKSSPDYDGGKWKGLGGRSGSDSLMWECRSTNIMAICGVCMLTMVLVALPLWILIVKRIGKVRAWLLGSITMAVSNILFVFVFAGQVKWLIVVCCLNGIPVGAKFLSDTILADIIDYDEFLTGQRREATYFMFRSFLPKIVMIPTSTLPIAFLGVFGYRKPVGGLPANQPWGVGFYVKAVICIGTITAILCYCIKRSYPIKEEDLPIIHEGIELHRNHEAAPDPIRRGILYKIPEVNPGAEQELFFDLGHFRRVRLQKIFGCAEYEDEEDAGTTVADGVKSLRDRTFRQQWQAVGVLVVALIASGCSLPLLSNATLQFIPTLLIIISGLVLVLLVYFVLRRRACLDIERMYEQGAVTEQRVSHILQNRAIMANKPYSPSGDESMNVVEFPGEEEEISDHELFDLDCD